MFPDGLRALFAPAAALPASLLMPLVLELPVELPVVVPGVVVVPGADDPVPVLPGADPPTELVPLVPPVEPVPVCAIASVLANVRAAANPSVLSFMVFSFPGTKGRTIAAGYVSSVDINRV